MRSPHPHAFARPCLMALLLTLASCGNSEPEYATARGTSAPAESTSATSSTTTAAATRDTSIEDSTAAAEPEFKTPSGETPERDLIGETGARSTLGRTRDSATSLRDKIQGGQETSPLAIIHSDENYVLVGGIRWEIPDGWRLAVPQDPQIKSEIGVPSAYGTGRITFTHTQTNAQSVISTWRRLMLDDVGASASPETTTTQMLGLSVTTSLIEGTYTGDGNDRPYYAIRLIIVELGDGTAVAGAYVATESHITENTQRWDEFVDSMSIR